MNECTFTSANLDLSERVMSKIGINNWECSRPVWEEREQVDDRCIWHADTANKPLAELVNTIGGWDLHGVLIPSKTDLTDLSFPDGTGFVDASLSGVTLRDADLSGANLRDATLSGGELAFADFSGAHLRSADLLQANLHGATLSEADLLHANLSEADLRDATLSETALVKTDLSDAELYKTNLSSAGLIDADLSKANLGSADLSGANLRYADLSRATAQRGLFSRANLFDTYLTGAKLEGAVFGDARFNERTFERLVPAQEPSAGTPGRLERLKQVLLGPTGDDSLRCVYDPASQYTLFDDGEEDTPEVRAAGVYREFERLAQDNAFAKWQQKFFHLRQDMQTRQKTGVSYWFAVLQRVLFGHGERFGRVVGWSGVIIAVFACINLLGGWIYPVTADGELGSPLVWTRLPEAPRVVWESLYYSTLTFTALGFGDYRPVSAVGQLATIAETAVGAVLLALLVFVLGRRAAR